MINYIYDGSFEGLLTSIYEAYYRHEFPKNIWTRGNIQESFLESYVHIETNLVNAQKVFKSIKEKISEASFDYAFYTHLSELRDAGTWIYNYLRLGWKLGSKVDLYEADDKVLVVHNTSRKVLGESHRMLGLLRFKQIGESLYYSVMEPDYNIAGLIAPHFADRLSDQNFIIHDVRRGIAVVYNQEDWTLIDANFEYLPQNEEGENDFQSLWKGYFRNISIKNRVNTRLQRKNMPARYWKHLTEKQLCD